MSDLYDMIGEEGFDRLTAAFYRRVPEDDILGPMYPRHDMAGAQERLCDFLVMRFGGPPRYVERRGHPRMRARHMRFRIDYQASQRWLSLMHAAMAESDLPDPAVQTLGLFFEQVAGFLINTR